MGIDDHSRIAFAGIMPDQKKRSAPPKVPRRRGFGRGQRIFLCAPLRGLVRTALSDYWRLRSRLGLTRHGEAAMIEKLGFAPIDLGKLSDGGRLQQFGGPLPTRNLTQHANPATPHAK